LAHQSEVALTSCGALDAVRRGHCPAVPGRCIEKGFNGGAPDGRSERDLPDK
jgi:hypothetical protein